MDYCDRDTFRTQSNIYGGNFCENNSPLFKGTFLRKKITAKNNQLNSQKSFTNKLLTMFGEKLHLTCLTEF